MSLPSSLTHRRSVGRSHGPRTRQNGLGATFAGLPCPTPSRGWKPLGGRMGGIPLRVLRSRWCQPGTDAPSTCNTAWTTRGKVLTWLRLFGLESPNGPDDPRHRSDPENPECLQALLGFRLSGVDPNNVRRNVSRLSRCRHGRRCCLSRGRRGYGASVRRIAPRPV